MERATFANPANLSLIEDYYERWQKTRPRSMLRGASFLKALS